MKKIYTECGNNLKFDKNVETRTFNKGQYLKFCCFFKGKGAKTALAYQDKNTDAIDHATYDEVIIFKVIDVTKTIVKIREVNPFTGKFYEEAKTLVCPKWTEARVHATDICHTTHGDILPCGEFTIYRLEEKCWIPTETYNDVELEGCMCYHGYVKDAYRGTLHVAKWNDGNGIAQYATITAPADVRMKPYKLFKKTAKTYLEAV